MSTSILEAKKITLEYRGLRVAQLYATWMALYIAYNMFIKIAIQPYDAQHYDPNWPNDPKSIV